jgi:integrase
MRRAYRDLLRRRDFKEFLRQYAGQMHPDDSAARMELISDYRLDILDSLEERTGLKDRRIKRMDDFNWLTPEQQAQLLNLPNTQTLRGTRDAAMISILLATGIRRIELAHLAVRHLKQKEHGNWALKLETVKTAADFIKERSVIWGEWLFCLEDYVYPWLNAAGISEGYVFRGIKGKTRLMRPPFHVATVNQVLKRYPITIGEATDHIRPHSLRRTYARSQYDAGMDIKSIALNMGHESTITTDRYIGGTDVEARAGRFSLPKGFAQIVRGEKARKRERAHRGMTTEKKWASIVMRTLERSRDGWFWLKEISSGVSRGQRVNISNAVSKLKVEGKIKKWKMPKPGGGHKRGLMISLPEGRYHPHIRDYDETTLNARLIILYPVEVN